MMANWRYWFSREKRAVRRVPRGVSGKAAASVILAHLGAHIEHRSMVTQRTRDGLSEFGPHVRRWLEVVPDPPEEK